MSRAKLVSSPLRYVSPGMLIACPLLFLMPWVQVQCNGDAAGGGGGMNFGNARPNPVINAGPARWVSFASQSGFQVASGSVSFLGADSGGLGMNAAAPTDKAEGAPLLWLFPIAAIAGIAVGFAMPSTNLRKIILAACCAAALGSAGGQAAMGFPIEKEVLKEAVRKNTPAAPMRLDFPGPIDPEMKRIQEKSEAAFEKMTDQVQDELNKRVRVSYQFCFYLALLVPFLALFIALIEPPARVRKRRALYELDDERAEDEDDFADDDDDDRPRRRRPRDDDDQPRRRRPRDDD